MKIIPKSREWPVHYSGGLHDACPESLISIRFPFIVGQYILIFLILQGLRLKMKSVGGHHINWTEPDWM